MRHTSQFGPCGGELVPAAPAADQPPGHVAPGGATAVGGIRAASGGGLQAAMRYQCNRCGKITAGKPASPTCGRIVCQTCRRPPRSCTCRPIE